LLTANERGRRTGRLQNTFVRRPHPGGTARVVNGVSFDRSEINNNKHETENDILGITVDV